VSGVLKASGCQPVFSRLLHCRSQLSKDGEARQYFAFQIGVVKLLFSIPSEIRECVLELLTSVFVEEIDTESSTY
jgi:hypothetical protein